MQKIKKVENVNLYSFEPIKTAKEVKVAYPHNEKTLSSVFEGREAIEKILKGEDKRIFAIVGPCSIHNTASAINYAKNLKELQDKVSDKILLVMRVYFEKPRTTVGWKGLINDPYINGTFDIQEGLSRARQLMLNIAEIGLPIATEALDPLTPQYLNDLVTWNAIGARTTESQTHREMASGLSGSVGFKNATDGDIDVAIHAILSSQQEHSFLGMTDTGKSCIVHTKGNKLGHLILRGGSDGPNFSLKHILMSKEKMEKAGINSNIIVDCSHANSNKDYKKQTIAWNTTIENIISGNSCIKGLMLESHLEEGKQNLPYPLPEDWIENQVNYLNPNVSITDACISWETTEKLILESYNKICK